MADDPTLTSRRPAPSVAPRLRTAWVALMLALGVFTGYLAWFTWDLLENRLQASSQRFDGTLRRFDRFWSLYDASVESAAALQIDLATLAASQAAAAPVSGEPTADAIVLADEVRRFLLQSAALDREVTEPGPLMLSQGVDFDQATHRLDLALALPINGDRSPAAMAEARAATSQVLEILARMGTEARQRQPLARVFREEVDAVRRHVLIAFGGVIGVLLLVVALALQWVRVARREGVTRRQAEHLAAVAEAERARAEYVARDKARFLGMLSHELLTPLQSLWSTMDLIESRGRLDVGDPAFQRLKESTRSLRGRISDLVDFAKMSSGRLETRIRGFQLDKLVDTALRDMEEALAAKNLDVHWEATPALSRRIWSDPARLRQVLDNLLSNAIKYTERGGLSIHAQLLDDDSILRLEVADTGCGIPDAALGRLFEPFFRAPDTAHLAEGSGLGLAVVKSLVDLMGGSIRVQSQVGVGTTFTVEVPVATSPEGVRETPAGDAGELPVLVVDDSRDARRAISEQVRALGHEVYEASSGAMGLAEASERDYLAIVVDLQMPDLDGLELAAIWRRPGNRHAHTFLVLVSAWNDAERAAVESLVDACIDKPVSRQQLAAVLQRAREGRPRAP